MQELVKVAVAVITNHKNEVLLSLRADDAHQGGLWEFPGGKVENNETVLAALKREILEELNIEIINASMFKSIQYQYPDKSVLLEILVVDSFNGDPEGAEGQQIKWQKIDKLKTSDFPLANRSIIHALQLSEKYMITGAFEDEHEFSHKLETSLKNGIRLVQLRCKNKSLSEYEQLVKIASSLCKKYSAKLLLNTHIEMFSNSDADGLHLSSQMLNSIKTRPISDKYLLSVSCHNEIELEKAKKLKADIVLLSPVKETQSHPGVKGIGWERFKQLTLTIEAPVYALGGMSVTDLSDAKKHGAQGVAAISSFWG